MCVYSLAQYRLVLMKALREIPVIWPNEHGGVQRPTLITVSCQVLLCTFRHIFPIAFVMGGPVEKKLITAAGLNIVYTLGLTGGHPGISMCLLQWESSACPRLVVECNISSIPFHSIIKHFLPYLSSQGFLGYWLMVMFHANAKLSKEATGTHYEPEH